MYLLPHLSISINFRLKKLPKGYYGKYGESINIGKDKRIELSNMLQIFTEFCGNYYGIIESAEYINNQIDIFKKEILPEMKWKKLNP